ncbi:DMT family transporter [Adhaeretor mobilis]|nr:DMT family transporter [Adhaeretor mobilis]
MERNDLNSPLSRTASRQVVSAPSNQFASGVTLAIVGTFLFALKSIFIKLAFAAGASPTLVLTLRLFFALPLYAIVLWRLRAGGKCEPLTRKQVLRALGLGFLGYYLASYLDLTGLSMISAQLERLTLFTYPAIVALLAWLFLGEELGPRVIFAILLSYAGVLLMYGGERAFTQSEHLGLGVLLVMGSALSYSLYILFAKPAMQRIGSAQFTSLAMIGSTCFVGVHFLLTQPWSDLIDAQPVVYLYGLILAFVCTVLPSYMINEAIVRIGATRTTVIGSVGPTLTMLLAIVVLDEPSSLQHFAGMAVAIAGVSLVARK